MNINLFRSTERNYSIDRYARELSQAFGGGHRVDVVSYSPSPRGLARQVDRYFGYLRHAARHRADGNIIVSEGLAYLLKALPPERTLCVCHDVHPLLLPGKKTLRERLYIRRYRWALRFLPLAKYVVAVSESTRSDLLNALPGLSAAKVVAIPNGLAPEWSSGESRQQIDDTRARYGWGGRRIVLHVGNDVWYKNFPAAVRSFAQLSEADLTLVHVGSVAQSTRALMERLQVGTRCVLLDNLGDEELRQLYSLAEAFVFPSLHEGFGWPPLEAMACGCPVVTTKRASLPEVCGDAALYCEADDPAQIAAAIRTVLTDSQLRDRMSKAGKIRAQQFSWAKTARRMLELLQE